MLTNESEASAILSSMRCVLSRMASDDPRDSSLAVLMPETMAAMAEAASAADLARELTSCATTAKPRPWSPAWAASIAALIESSFVRVAI
jgi:hypothetical protein